MGILGLYEFLRKKCPSAITVVHHVDQLKEFFKKNPRAAVDTAIYMYTAAYQAAKQNSQEGVEIVIPSMDQRICLLYNRLVGVGCKATFVLDSEAHPLKQNHIHVKRQEKRNRAKKHLVKLESELNLIKQPKNEKSIMEILQEQSKAREIQKNDKIDQIMNELHENSPWSDDDEEMTDEKTFKIQQKKAQIQSQKIQLIQITREDHVQLGKSLVKVGIPVKQSPMWWDAEKFCAYLCMKNECDVVISTDGDTLAFGAPFLIVHLFSTRHKTEIYDLKKILSCLNLTLDMFQQMCVMVGSDFSAGIKGIGPKKAWEYIKEYKTIENFLHSIDGIMYYKAAQNCKLKEALEIFQKFENF